MLKNFKFFALVTGIFMQVFFAASCTPKVLVDPADFSVSVKVLDGVMEADGTLVSLPKLRVRVSHPEGKGGLLQVVASIPDNDPVFGYVKEGETGVIELDFDAFVEDGETRAEATVRVIYGFDGSGGGPLELHNGVYPLQIKKE